MPQLTTRTGKPVINRNTKTPMYNLPVDMRIKNIKKQLYSGMTTHDAKWASIAMMLKTI